MKWKSTYVAIEGGPAYPALIVRGDTWNGWEKPYFTKEAVIKMAADNDWKLDYIAQPDGFAITDDAEVEHYGGVDIVIDGQTVRTYPIGAGSWIWSECEPPVPTEIGPALRDKMIAVALASFADASERGRISREAYDDLAKRVADMQEKATPDEIERARNLYAEGSDDDIEIDADALTSRVDNGTWVSAWVWLPAPDEVCFGCEEGFGCGPVETPPGGILFDGHRFCSEECKDEYAAERSRELHG